jgi:outer membrane receptor protein involved in Fe transport
MMASLSAFAAFPDAGPGGAIRGTVWDRDFGVPLAGVRVSAVEAGRIGLSGPAGEFRLDGIPPGSYTLIFSKEGYERVLLTGIAVTAGQLTDVRADLSAEVVELPEMVVTGGDLLAGTENSLLEIRAAAVTLQDAISSELFSQAGVSDVAGALKLVTGATVVEGKYATVRGLSDRYTGITLNGLRVPSADPRRRAVQIDQFPTGTIESIDVSKTFTPDLQGDFTGGGVDIRTKSIPDGRVLSVSLATEYQTLATANDSFLTYEGGGAPLAGVDGGSRSLPREAKDPLPPVPNMSRNPTAADVAGSVAYDRLTRSFDPAMGVAEQAPGPNTSFAMVGGNRHALGGDGAWGYLTALTYSHKFDFYEDGLNNSARRSSAQDTALATLERIESKGNDEVMLGALGALFFQPAEGHEVSLRLIANQSADDEARLQTSPLVRSPVQQNQSLLYTERTVASLQLQGSDAFPEAHDLHLDWATAASYTRQYEPDVRFFRNDLSLQNLVASKPSNSTEPQNTRRIWRDGEERDGQAAVDVTLPFKQWSDLDGKLKAGLFAERTDRDFTQTSFTYFFANQVPSGADYAENFAKRQYMVPTLGDLWTDVFTDPDRIGLATNTPPAPNQLLWYLAPTNLDVNYTADQNVNAVYAMAELPVAPRWTLVAGARRETTEISILPSSTKPCTLFPGAYCVETIQSDEEGNRTIMEIPDHEAAADISEPRLLPALGAIWSPTPSMKVRAAWSRTLARPTFRELAPIATEEFLFGDEFLGNPDLVLSEIENLDLRWEWFPSAGRLLSASVFTKSLTDPIEYISFFASNRSFIQPVNYEHGSLRGIEIEGRTSLDWISDAWKGVAVGMNFTLLDSEVDVPEDEQASLADFGLAEETRRLQGQPEYVGNVNVTWDSESTGTSAGLFFNVVGETLLSGAARAEDGIPNVFEGRLATLNLTAQQRLRKGWTLQFQAKNLTAPTRRSFYLTPDGLEAPKAVRETARLFSLGGSWKW